MPKPEVKKVIRRYADKLKSEGFNFKEIYLFGSCAKGGGGKWSDIDIVIISDKLKRNRENNYLKLWHW